MSQRAGSRLRAEWQQGQVAVSRKPYPGRASPDRHPRNR